MKNNILDTLKFEYGYNSPIFLSDFPDSDSDATRQFVSRCVRSGKLRRFRKGIYYFPTRTRWGESLLSPLDVCRRKYIRSGEDVYGYISGVAFENEAGFTTQVPNAVTIRTNRTASRQQNFVMEGQNVILKKTRVTVTSENQKELQFLDLINDMSPLVLQNKRNELQEYCRQNKLSRKIVADSLNYYPARVSKRLIEEGIYDVLA